MKQVKAIFFDVDATTILESIDEVIQHDFIPIIAHPERYDSVQVSSTLFLKMIEHGALLQMDKASVFGGYGRMAKETALEILDNHCYHFVGSDAHGLYRRTSLMYDSYCFVKDYYGENYANKIYNDNALDMLKNVDIRKREENE